ncbi:HK97 gp10 family phage protein [Sinorhizobium sp. 7-81]|uniref:HK97-gp10 family putative phage morphogenesis protein n=1 Tax=Sinorhizobium sp. 8-89 TaxID=3049089 RepID=UPI0024C22D38|nr:HK97-gp10 family putative phage morphogenesis protein [Sinorhizobium sp. 8-89]MDK1489376.1 HK97 gp10 family phage protein [Sinorhizobium sp. 8-89]
MVHGIAALEKKLAAMPKRVEHATRKAMEKGAEELCQMMRRLVPVDSGDLKASISWTWGEAPKGALVLAESEPTERGLKITVYTTDWKARWVEFGTVKMSAQPFFFPSWRSLRKRIKSRIVREQRKAIRFVGPVTQSEA